MRNLICLYANFKQRKYKSSTQSSSRKLGVLETTFRRETLIISFVRCEQLLNILKKAVYEKIICLYATLTNKITIFSLVKPGQKSIIFENLLAIEYSDYKFRLV